ncbi:MAG: hypothetical protein AB7F09_18570 [Parvibaculaceae bacterium]
MSTYRSLAAALPLAGLVLSAPALAGQWPKFDLIRLTPIGAPPEITVESDNGTSWTRVTKRNFAFLGRVEVKMDLGKVVWYWVKHTGKEIDDDETGRAKSFSKVVQLPTSTDNLGIAALTAVSACNAKLAAGADISKDQHVSISTDLELHAAAETNSEKLVRDAVGIFPVKVRCIGIAVDTQPTPPPVADTDDLKQPEEKFKVLSAALGIHKPQSNACPAKARINTRIRTNFAGKVTFIYRQAGGGKSAPISVMSKKLANGKFYAVHNQVVDIKKAVDTKYMVEVVGKGIISDWQALKVPCKIGLGGGDDLASQPEIPFKVLSAQLGIKGPKTRLCPNKATLTAWFKTNKPGKVGFRLMRKNGPAGPMIFANAVKAPSGYMATYTRVIEITKPISTSYSAVVPGAGGLASNFVPLKASCALGQPGIVLGE